MNLSLENLYYITTIAISIGVYRHFIKYFTISSSFETIFINRLQKNLVKFLYFFKSTIFFAFLYLFILFMLSFYTTSTILIIDVIMFELILVLFDLFSPLIFKNTKFFKNYIKISEMSKKLLLLLISLCIYTIYGVLSFCSNKIFTIIQIIVYFLIYFDKFDKIAISKNHIEIKLDLGLFFIFMTPLYIKLIFLYYNFPNYDENNFSKLLLRECIKNLFLNKGFIPIIGLLLFSSYTITHLRYNFKSFIYYKNKYWEITNVTFDGYMICTYNNFTSTIKADTIKNDYLCMYYKNCYYFYREDNLKGLDLYTSEQFPNSSIPYP